MASAGSPTHLPAAPPPPGTMGGGTRPGRCMGASGGSECCGVAWHTGGPAWALSSNSGLPTWALQGGSEQNSPQRTLGHGLGGRTDRAAVWRFQSAVNTALLPGTCRGVLAGERPDGWGLVSCALGGFPSSFLWLRPGVLVGRWLPFLKNRRGNRASRSLETALWAPPGPRGATPGCVWGTPPTPPHPALGHPALQGSLPGTLPSRLRLSLGLSQPPRHSGVLLWSPLGG